MRPPASSSSASRGAMRTARSLDTRRKNCQYGTDTNESSVTSAPALDLHAVRDDLERLAEGDPVSREVEHAPRATRVVVEQTHRPVERPRERDGLAVVGLEGERDRRLHVDVAQQCGRARHAAQLERGRGPDLVALDRAGDRSGELAVLDPEPVDPSLEPFPVDEPGQRSRVGSGIARVRTHERRGRGPSARRLHRIVGRHLIRCAAGPVGPVGDGLQETTRVVTTSRAVARRTRIEEVESTQGMLASGGAGRAAAVGLRIGRGKSGLRRAGCWGTQAGATSRKAQQRTDRRARLAARGKGETVR